MWREGTEGVSGGVVGGRGTDVVHAVHHPLRGELRRDPLHPHLHLARHVHPEPACQSDCGCSREDENPPLPLTHPLTIDSPATTALLPCLV